MKGIIVFVVLIMLMVLPTVFCACQKVPEKYQKNWSKDQQYGESDYRIIDVDEDINILQLTDIHYDSTNDKKAQTIELLKDVITQANPDLIAVTGDWCSHTLDRKKNSKEVFDIIDSFGIPWAVVFGNHDREGIVSAYDYADMFAGYKNCVFDAGYSNIGGVGNYTVVLRQNGKIAGACLFMDTHSSVRIGSTKYESIDPKQIEWYKWTIDGLNELYKAEGNGSAIPTLLYTHIPVNEYIVAYEQGEILLGSNGEKCCVPEENTGMYKAIKEKASTKAIFCGHDHANNSVALYEGVKFVYGVQSGWCKGYATDVKKGATLALLKDGEVEVSHIYHEM